MIHNSLVPPQFQLKSIFAKVAISATVLLTCLCLSVEARLPPGIINTQTPGDEPPTPAESLQLISAPEGFQVSLFAGEPDVAQPIAINYDDRGRLWVLESFSYIEWKRKARDRILIFEDTDNDGTFDKRKVFWDRGNHMSGFQIGYGGVWVCDAPNLVFIPDANRDDIPDGEPEVILDGWTLHAEHNFLNGLTWGPDGWLYGRHGIKQPSFVGKPGAPSEERIELSCAIWRYHPIRKTFEVFADGTINPWGLDWNEDGQPFITTSVIDHLWHLVPGARFARFEERNTSHPNPYSFDLMGPASDHRHWTGGETQRMQFSTHDHVGGGHSHCGLMIYQSESWPAQYRGRAFFSNILGQRINMDHLQSSGSTYRARHGADFLKGGSDWFRAVDLKQGPYGEMIFAEWTDLGECHDRDGIHRTSGRLYHVSYGDDPAPQKIDVASMETDALLDLLLHENVWWRRRALRNLYERAAQGEALADERCDWLLQKTLHGPVKDAVIAVQALHAFLPHDFAWRQQVFESSVASSKSDDRAAVRAQVISLTFADGSSNVAHIKWLEQQLRRESAPLVQLIAAGVSQRIPLENRFGIVQGLIESGYSEDDHNMTLMLWYALEPLVPLHPQEALTLATSNIAPFLSQSIARRAVSADALDSVIGAVAKRPDSPRIADLLEGLLIALPAQAPTPKGWSRAHQLLKTRPDPEIQLKALRLAHRFGDPSADTEMMALVLNARTAPPKRKEFLQILVDSKSELLGQNLSRLIHDPHLGNQAIRAVSTFPDRYPATRLIELFENSDNPDQKNAILDTLASRTDFADTLVERFLSGHIDRKEIPAFTARQITRISTQGEQFAAAWGVNKKDAESKTQQLQKWKSRLTDEFLSTADPVAGREVFLRACSACHRLYGEGGQIGPDLTGSNRANLDYFLISVLFPNEDVSDAYKLVSLTLSDGRSLTGNVIEENDKVLTLKQVGQSIRIDKADIIDRSISDVSMMPPGLLDNLNIRDTRDLIGYLRTLGPLTE